MWKVEGLTHRYPTKVLAELLSTCPQYCGHCTRMDLVGNDVPQVEKLKFDDRPSPSAATQMLDYLRKTPSVRDVVVSGGDIANVPIAQLESLRLSALLDIPNIRDIRLASKGLMGCRQHFLQDDVLTASSGWPRRRSSGASTSRCTRTSNHANQVTPLVGAGRDASCWRSAFATCETRASCCAA